MERKKEYDAGETLLPYKKFLLSNKNRLIYFISLQYTIKFSRGSYRSM
jgi:hypothetical protein